MTTPSRSSEPFPCAALIKEIGRGKNGARSMSGEQAYDLYGAILDGRVSDLELGGILLSMRIKGESVEELSGFLRAAHERCLTLEAPHSSLYCPVLIPTYNGARKLPNLTPLLAMLLARSGVPVLVHGVQHDHGRVTSFEILEHLGIRASRTNAELAENWRQGLPGFMTIDDLSPSMERILRLRAVLGVRNSTHTLVKILQPFSSAALRLTSFTHPEYHAMLGEFFGLTDQRQRGDVLLMRGTEGETVAHPIKTQEVAWFHDGQRETLIEKEIIALSPPPLLPDRSADHTATWISSVLTGEVAVPASIQAQFKHCLALCKKTVSTS
jgi:anthranilate phosphoribosyltransferase